MKIILIGGANGIGKNAAKYLRDKNEVTVIDRDKEALEKLEKVEKIHLDITVRKRVREELTGLEVDVLVNCAGVQKQGSVEDMEIEEFEEHIYHNYIGVINTIQACLPALRESEGKIVNVSSIAGLSSAPFLSGYCASKHAVEGFTDSLRRELKNIDVVLVEPGRVKTGFNEEGIDNLASYEDSNYSEIYDDMLSEEVGGMRPEKAGRKLAFIALNGSKPRYTITKEAWIISKLEKIIPARVVDFLFRNYQI
ncbi:short-chain oxidoreductase [Candidatus Haloredivivus sp. G17]|nr:short-chain oxidoreductase [Candidatus Haloredivivus sp. G17]